MTTKETMLKEVWVDYQYDRPAIFYQEPPKSAHICESATKYIIASEYERLRKQADALADALEEMLFDKKEGCSYDYQGNCKAHGYLNPFCGVAEAKEALIKYREGRK